MEYIGAVDATAMSLRFENKTHDIKINADNVVEERMEERSGSIDSGFYYLIICILLTIALLLALTFVACGAPKNDKSEVMNAYIKDFKHPIYKDAKNIKNYVLGDGLTRGVSYNVKIFYPANEVMEFYEAEMRRLGYKPTVDKVFDKDWHSFVDGTKQGEPYVAQLSASWTDQSQNVRTVLILRYYWYVDQKRTAIILESNEDLNVAFQIMPFFTIPTKNK